MQLNRRLLEIIGKRIPQIYDVIPRGPQGRLGRVALNPQPIPPHELGAAVADEFVRSVWFASRNGLDIKVAFDDLEDWCPTRPRKIKVPIWWPIPPEPEPGPDWFVDYHLGFASRLAVVASDAKGVLSEHLGKAIDRSLDSIGSLKL